MDKEMIERLKQNRVDWRLLTQEEKECFDSVGAKNNCQWFDGKDWVECYCREFNCSSIVYRIKSDYQPPKPELKIVKCEINASYSRLGFEYKGNNYGLCKAVNLPNFSHFEYGTGEMSISERLFKDKIQFCGQTPNKPAEYPKYVVFVEQGE